MDKKYEVASNDVSELCHKIIKAFPSQLGHVKHEDVAFAFKNGTKSCWHAKVGLLKGLVSIFTNKKIGILVFKESWTSHNEDWKALLLYHELLHVGWDGDKSKYKIVKHDIEDFSNILSKYGLCWEGSAKFLETVKGVTV